MAKGREPGKDIVKMNAPASIPSYLAEHVENDTSLVGMKEYRVVPRLKVIQTTAKQELLKLFDAGDVIIQPGAALVVKHEKSEDHSAPFLFVPVFFFVEFCKWADLKDSSSQTILARSFDLSSDIAKNARSEKTREEKYGEGKFTARYCEHLNFLCFIYNEDNPLKGELVTLSFARGEFGTGTNFISTITIRKAPLWSQIFTAHTSYRDKGPDRKWWGIDVKPAEGTNFVPESEVQFFKDAHVEMKKLYDEKRIIVDHSDRDEEADDPTKPKM